MESPDESPPSKKAKSSSAPIDELPDSLLAKIFAYLPHKDRHQLCLVSSAWAATSRIPWSNVIFLNISTIPRAMVDSILGLCPMLQELYAKDVTINLEMNATPISANLHTMKLCNVKFASSSLSTTGQTDHRVKELFREYFSRFPKLSDLTWQDVTCIALAASLATHVVLPSATAASIRRLILVTSNRAPSNETIISISLRGLMNLECLYSLDNTAKGIAHASIYRSDLPNLREACLAGSKLLVEPIVKALFEAKLPKLEVLMVASGEHMYFWQVAGLLQACSALRILAIAGRDTLLADHHSVDLLFGDGGEPAPVTLPAPAVGDRSGVPPLEIFVGGDFTNYVRFTLPKKSGLANFWRIDCSMPQYLAKPEVASIFKDTWIAKVIREGSQNGLLPWGSPNDAELFYSTSPLLFL